MAKKNEPTHIVAQPFTDAAEYIQGGEAKAYEVGQDVSDLAPERLVSLVDRGLVKSTEATAD